jgi:hypothetical protein
VNDQPPHSTPPTSANPGADGTEWPGEAGPGWQPAPPAAAFGNPPPPPPDTPYGAQPGPAYGAQPGPAYGAQPGPAYGAQPGPAYGPPQPGAYPGFPGPGAPGYPPPGSGGTSGFAIASLIFGILGGVLLSVIFGIVALVQIRKRGQTGRGMAIAGLTLSGCWVLLIIVGVTAGLLSDSDHDSATSATGTGTVSVTTLKAGDCIKGLRSTGSTENLPRVPCSLPHEGEVYAVFQLPAGPWPGDTAVQQQAETRCNAELKIYAPKAADTAEVLYLHPLQQSWKRDRGVTCIATDEKGSTIGSVRD